LYIFHLDTVLNISASGVGFQIKVGQLGQQKEDDVNWLPVYYLCRNTIYFLFVLPAIPVMVLTKWCIWLPHIVKTKDSPRNWITACTFFTSKN